MSLFDQTFGHPPPPYPVRVRPVMLRDGVL
jgi:hypothetical protein